ncbi:hypothetical protein FGO68_gene3582 [Halteria grandinella]|uniref:Uncharacterized protein n=1 Tax=Halteria grandinella TaxID=5974 RepID=A0A8J8T2Y6_HALGN|nr:hypothetical protein FGO68_gene3582 [Halteria grandinella]
MSPSMPLSACSICLSSVPPYVSISLLLLNSVLKLFLPPCNLSRSASKLIFLPFVFYRREVTVARCWRESWKVEMSIISDLTQQQRLWNGFFKRSPISLSCLQRSFVGSPKINLEVLWSAQKQRDFSSYLCMMFTIYLCVAIWLPLISMSPFICFLSALYCTIMFFSTISNSFIIYSYSYCLSAMCLNMTSLSPNPSQNRLAISSGYNFASLFSCGVTSGCPPVRSGREKMRNSSEFRRIEYCESCFRKRSRKQRRFFLGGGPGQRGRANARPWFVEGDRTHYTSLLPQKSPKSPHL